MIPGPSSQKRTIQEAVWYCSHAAKVDDQSLILGLALDGTKRTSKDLKWLKEEAIDIYCTKNREKIKFKGRGGIRKLDECSDELFDRACRTRGLHHIQDLPREWLKWAFHGLIRAAAQNLNRNPALASLEGRTPCQDREEMTPQTGQSPSSAGTLSPDGPSAPYSGREDADTSSVALEVPPRSARAAGTKNKTGFRGGFPSVTVAQTPIAQVAGSTGRTAQEVELRGSSTLGEFLTLLALVNDFAGSTVGTAQEVDLRRSRTLEFLSKISTLVDGFAESTGKTPQQVWHLLCNFRPTGDIGNLRSNTASYEAMEQHIDVQPLEDSADEAAMPDLEVKREPELSIIQNPSAARKRKANSIDEDENAGQSDGNTRDVEKRLVEMLRDESRPSSRTSPHQRSDTAGDEVTIAGARKRSRESEKKGRDMDDDDVVVVLSSDEDSEGCLTHKRAQRREEGETAAMAFYKRLQDKHRGTDRNWIYHAAPQLHGTQSS